MVSASDNSSGAAERTRPPLRSLKVTDRPAAAGTAVCQPIGDLPPALCEKLSSSFAWDNAIVTLGLSSPRSLTAVKNNANGDGKPLRRQSDLENEELARTSLATNNAAFLVIFPFNNCRFYFPEKGQLEKKYIHIKRDSWFFLNASN